MAAGRPQSRRREAWGFLAQEHRARGSIDERAHASAGADCGEARDRARDRSAERSAKRQHREQHAAAEQADGRGEDQLHRAAGQGFFAKVSLARRAALASLELVRRAARRAAPPARRDRRLDARATATRAHDLTLLPWPKMTSARILCALSRIEKRRLSLGAALVFTAGPASRRHRRRAPRNRLARRTRRLHSSLRPGTSNALISPYLRQPTFNNQVRGWHTSGAMYEGGCT